MKIQITKKISALLHRLSLQSGFTLVELMVAMSIFGVFMAVIMGAFVQVLANERVTLKLLEATDNLGVAIEQMSREIRVGEGFAFTSSSEPSLSFSRPSSGGNQTTTLVKYTLSGDKIMRTEGTDSAPLTSPAVKVVSFQANITTNSGSGQSKPTKVQLVIGIAAQDRGITVTRYVQTTVSQRVF
jgi:prepilin-type N-terminal cleavage/methylation domain-containing protein